MTTTSTQPERSDAMPVSELTRAWANYRERHPHTRIRDAAQELGVSEAELLATKCGATVTRLSAPEGNFGVMIEELRALGRVMALTRNDEAVIERKGVYSRIDLFPAHHRGQVLDEGIDLRLFFTPWAHAFALDEEVKQGDRRRSIQFFSASGEAIHKVFLQDDSDKEAFNAYVARFRCQDQSPAIEVTAAPAPEPERPDSEIDLVAFRDAWARLQDTHEFFGLTRRFGVTRTQALRLASPGAADKVETSSLRRVLEAVAEIDLPIMVFVGNPGCIEIHSGPIRNVKCVKEWLNVLDPDFNLHVREDLIHAAWVVRKPTREGIVSSLELYNARGGQIAMLFSKRKDYKEESEVWRKLLAALS